MNKMKLPIEVQKIVECIKNYPVITTIIAVIIIVILILILRHIHIRNQYSDEAWKIVKKNGRKSIFWYDENGNETYKRPKKNPNRPKPLKRK